VRPHLSENFAADGFHQKRWNLLDFYFQRLKATAGSSAATSLLPAFSFFIRLYFLEFF